MPDLMRLLQSISVPLDSGNEHFLASHMEITTVDVGNPSHNIIPGKAFARFNIRFNDQWSAQALRQWLKERLDEVELTPGVSWELDYWSKSSEAFLTTPGEFLALLRDTIEAETGRKAKLSTAGGTSDARFVIKHCPVGRVRARRAQPAPDRRACSNQRA